METHVAMASGGAYAALHAGFWEAVDSTLSGQRFRNSVTSISGSSAGALVGMLVAEGVPGRLIAQDLRNGGIQGRFPRLRAAAAYFHLPGFRRSAFSAKPYISRVTKLANARVHARLPMTVAVTDTTLVQRCVPLDMGAFRLPSRVTAAVASASIPLMLPPQRIGTLGMCADGSVNRCSFAEDTLRNKLLTSKGNLLILNCLPYPENRGQLPRPLTGGLTVARIAGNYGEQLYAHSMERLFRDTIFPPVQFKDGMFELFINNTCGRCAQVGADEPYDLHVVFVAPTTKQYLACGGMHSITDLHYGKGHAPVAHMVEVGKLMGHQYVQRYGELTFM